MRNWKKCVSLVVCVLVFSAFALGSGSNEGSQTSKAEEETEMEKSVKEEKAVEEKTEEKKEKDETNKVEKKTEYRVGETLEHNGLMLTYVASSNYISNNDFIQPAEGNKYIRLYFYAENQSDSDKNVSVYDFKCYADGYDCAAAYFDDDLSTNLSSGRVGEGAVYFEIPENAEKVEVEYELNLFTEEKVKFLFEGEQDSGIVLEKNTSVSSDAVHVGETVETDSLRITYMKAEEYVSDNQFLQPAEGNKYIYIELDVENISDSDQALTSFSFECYADGASCDGYYGMDNELNTTLSAGRKAAGTVAFEVPKNAEVVEIEYEDNIWTGSKIVFAFE